MNTTLPEALPEISLITSWLVPTGLSGSVATSPPALSAQLQCGLNLVDLYFLNHFEIQWYAKQASKSGTSVNRSARQDPHQFAASLTAPQLDCIADKLHSELTEKFGGRLIGPRPQFVAMTTFFPNISLTAAEEDAGAGITRQSAILAVRNSLYLASKLGCHCVEIVSGAGIPGREWRATLDYSGYRGVRRQMLVSSLIEVFNKADNNNILQTLIDDDTVPFLALELEPGPSFLLNSLDEYKRVKAIITSHFSGSSGIIHPENGLTKSLKLNIDVAHAFLIGYSPDDVKTLGLIDDVAHMHLSDHGGHKSEGGAHTSDLRPNTFHRFGSYEPWLKFAIERTKPRARTGSFSGVISLEMEACNVITEVLDAITITRQWLEKCGETSPSRQKGVLAEGALLVFDIGRSTETIFGGNASHLTASKSLESTVDTLCKCVHDQRGSVMSFTGDGFIAFFDKSHFALPADAVVGALNAAIAACQEVGGGRKKLLGRASLHWGDVYIPTSGRLRDQIIGESVVCAVRICDWLSHVREPAMRQDVRGTEIAASDAYHRLLPAEHVDRWQNWGKVHPKGLKDDVKVYLRQVP